MGQWQQLYNNRQWQRLRKAQLERQPLCERCEVTGRITAATVCDHIDPHKGDVAKFWAGPFSSLCKYHHDVKTIMEDGGLNSAASAHPAWLPTPACPVVLVTGPPGAGKTTYARQQAEGSDLVIDLDDCYLEVCGVHGHRASREYLGKALQLRNKLLANLASKRSGVAYVIVSSPTQAECDWWLAKLGAEHVRLDPGVSVCLARTGIRQALVRKWYAAAKANDWRPPAKAKGGCDASGAPHDATHHWHA